MKPILNTEDIKKLKIEKEYYSIDDMFEDFKKKCKGE